MKTRGATWGGGACPPAFHILAKDMSKYRGAKNCTPGLRPCFILPISSIYLRPLSKLLSFVPLRKTLLCMYYVYCKGGLNRGPYLLYAVSPSLKATVFISIKLKSKDHFNYIVCLCLALFCPTHTHKQLYTSMSN